MKYTIGDLIYWQRSLGKDYPTYQTDFGIVLDINDDTVSVWWIESGYRNVSVLGLSYMEIENLG